MSRYLISKRTGTVHSITPMLASRRDMLPAPQECVDLYVMGIESFNLIEQPGGGFQFEPIVPSHWRVEMSVGDDTDFGPASESNKQIAAAARARFDAVQAYLTGGKQAVAAVAELAGSVPGGTLTEPEGGFLKRPEASVSLKPATAEELSVPADFDLNVNISTMSKPELMVIGGFVKGLIIPESMKVAQIRDLIQESLDMLKAKGVSNAA